MRNNDKLGELVACFMAVAVGLACIALAFMAWPGYY